MTDAERIEKLKALVVSLRPSHHYCEDRWYSCPLHPEGTANEFATPGVCDCGADAINARIDIVLKEIT